MTKVAQARCAFNQLVLILFSLVGIVAAADALFTPTRALSALATELNNLRSASPTSLESTAAIIAVTCAVVLILQIVPGHGRKVFEAKVEGGSVEYPAHMVVKTIESNLEDIDGIETARVQVQGDHRKVDVHATLTVHPEEDSQALATRAASVIREKLEGLGLESRQLRLAFKPTADENAPNHRRITQMA